MAALKHVWAGASILATLVICVLVASGEVAFVTAITGDALTTNTTSIVLEFWLQFTNTSQAEAVPPAVPNTWFGQIDVWDVPITNMSDPNSLEIGRGRAALLFDQPSAPSGYQNKVTLVFNNNSGFPANSSINLEGFEPFELQPPGYNYSVVGGTGAFACARGVISDVLVFSNSSLETFPDIVHMVVGWGFNNRNAFDLFGSAEP